MLSAELLFLLGRSGGESTSVGIENRVLSMTAQLHNRYRTGGEMMVSYILFFMLYFVYSSFILKLSCQ